MDKMSFHIERDRGTRFFGLYCNESLVCVTVHKKGAIAVREMMQAILDGNENAQARITKLIKRQSNVIDRNPRETKHV